MAFETWLIFVPAAFALNVAPGPSNILAMSNGARFGFPAAASAGFGRLLAFAVMILLTMVGLGAVLAASEPAYQVIKWLGAAYLIWLGIRLWRAAPAPQPAGVQSRFGAQRSWVALARQEALAASGNPKAILIFTAFFPQFLNMNEAIAPQFAIMGVTFLVLEAVAIVAYAQAGGRLRSLTSSFGGLRLLNRIGGGTLIGAGVLLAVSRRNA